MARSSRANRSGLRAAAVAATIVFIFSSCSAASVPVSFSPNLIAGTLPPSSSEVVVPNEDLDPAPRPPQVFWDRLATGNLPGALTLADATSLSDLILVGRWVGLERGALYATPSNETVEAYADALIEVDQWIKGDDSSSRTATVRVPFLLALVLPGTGYPEAAFDEIDRNRPNGPAVLFLQSWANYLDRGGAEVPDWIEGLDRADAFRTIGVDGALPLEDGAVSDLVYEYDMPEWRIALAGEPLDDVLSDISTAAAARP